MTVRARLTGLYAALFLATGAVLLGVSYVLVRDLFAGALPSEAVDAALASLRASYALALVGATLVSVALGWLVAGRVLAPLSRVTAAARRVSEDRLGERIGLEGPHDELRELADTFDGMLDRLSAAFASQRRFVANASHELRTPLTVIRTEVEVALADEQASVGELRAMGEAVRVATIQCERLIEGLLTLARSESGLLARRDRVDVGACALEAVGQVVGEARTLGVRVDVRAAAAGAALVAGDAALVGRLVANLVENGVRHNREGGWVRVSVDEEGGFAVVRVENTGEVISEAVAARLLEPFQRVTRRADGGAGLGLSIVRTVASAHGGRVVLAPREDGGLVVTVALPLTEATSTSTPAAARRPAGAGNGARPAGRR
jgi:signal transduction histidine kinase